jgi:hypothetical protein
VEVYVGEAHARVERVVSIVKRATVLDECITEEQNSVVSFFFVHKLSPSWQIFADEEDFEVVDTTVKILLCCGF